MIMYIMSDTTVIQVRVPAEIKRQSERQAQALGLRSVQEAIRVFLASFAKGWAKPGIFTEKPDEYISLTPEAEKRYTKMIENIKKGKNITKTKNIDELFRLLRL